MSLSFFFANLSNPVPKCFPKLGLVKSIDFLMQWRLRNKPAVDREVRGGKLGGAGLVAFLYDHRDEAQFRLIRKWAEKLCAEREVGRVVRFVYVPLPEKQLPHFYFQKRDEMYLCRSDWSLFREPRGAVAGFDTTPWDLLVCLEPSPSLPLQYIMWSSQARMKVGSSQRIRPGDCDVLIVPQPGETAAGFSQRSLEFLLNTPMVSP
jgi:hypothetical protein